VLADRRRSCSATHTCGPCLGQAALLQLLYQTKTLSTAVLGVVILGKALRLNQWAALTILVVVCLTALELQAGLRSQASPKKARGGPQSPGEQTPGKSATHTLSRRLGQGVVMAQGGDDSHQKGGALAKGNVTVGVMAALGMPHRAQTPAEQT
jgi:drug/metabolite transporter (DMT)-like permease